LLKNKNLKKKKIIKINGVNYIKKKNKMKLNVIII